MLEGKGIFRILTLVVNFINIEVSHGVYDWNDVFTGGCG
jgi:hypothetical protein